ncbi:MAG: IscS subfamily cysteine desulfurase [Bdellovibrionota bacterium]
MKLPIYLDHHATTPMDPAVFQAMAPFFTEVFGNASSRQHEYGWTAEAAVEKARTQVARLIRANEKEIIFTSGGTESDNLAILGVAEAYREKGRHIVTTAIEHKAVLDTCEFLRTQGFEITLLPVNQAGQVRPEDVKKAIRPDTILVSVMFANNEVGTINPIAEIAKICKAAGVIFHSDGVQALAHVPIDVEALGVDLLSLSAHKIYGPKGCGALFVRRKNPRVKLTPQIHGGGHERGLRSGTLNVPGIVGFGAAAELVQRQGAEDVKRVAALRDRLWQGIHERLDEIFLNGHPQERLPNNLNVSFAHVEGESLMMGMRELAVSTGSACTTADMEPSYVLREMGLPEELSHSSIRFGLGRFTTREEIDFAVERIVETVGKLRELSPLYKGKAI